MSSALPFCVIVLGTQNDDHGAREDVLRWADGCMLVYSVTSRQSFQILAELRKKVEETKRAAHVPVILVGNKADLAHYREVTQDEGKQVTSFVIVVVFITTTSIVVVVVNIIIIFATGMKVDWSSLSSSSPPPSSLLLSSSSLLLSSLS